MIATHQQAGGRRDDRRRAGRQPGGASALGIMRLDDTGRVVGFLEKPQDRAGTRHWCAPTRPGSTPAASPAAAATAWPTWASTCSTATRWSTCCTKTDYRDFGKEIFPGVDPHAARAGPPVRRLLGRHRHDQVVLRGEPGAGRAGRRRSSWRRPTAPIYSRARFLPPSRIDGATIRGSLVADGCDDRGGGGDREQRDRPALPHRPQRDDPQLDPDGQRLLRDARRDRRQQPQRPSRRWASARARASKGRSSTRTAASAATCGSSTNGASIRCPKRRRRWSPTGSWCCPKTRRCRMGGGCDSILVKRRAVGVSRPVCLGTRCYKPPAG